MNLSPAQPPRIEDEQTSAIANSKITQGHLRENALCMSCKSPLNLSAVRCPNCGQRHAMASCSCCGEALFKHASTKVILELRELPEHGTLMSRLWQWVRSPKPQEATHYFHRVCAEEHSALLSAAISVVEANRMYLQPASQSISNASSVLSRERDEMQLSSQGREIQAIAKSSSENSEPADLSAQTGGDSLEAWFSEDSPGQSELLQPYQAGERNFSKAKFQGLAIEQRCLRSIVLHQADLRRSAWKSVDLSEVDLSEALADYSSFIDTSFKGSRGRNMSLREGKVILSDLTHSDLYAADLRRSDFYSSSLQQAKLTLVNLTEARLDAVDLSLSRLVMANLTRASLMEAILEEANCEQANFSHANLSWVNLKNGIATRANFSEAVLQCAELQGVDLSDAILLGTDCLGANIEQARSLQGALYNDLTRFPIGFNPEERGMIHTASRKLETQVSPLEQSVN